MSDEPMSESPFSRILFCTDFSENADIAFEYALDAAKRRPGCILYLLHVIPEPEAQFWKTYIYEIDEVDRKARQDIDAKIAETYQRRIPSDVHFEVAIRIGREYVEILQFAGDNDVNLLVLGRHGHTAFGEWLFGGVTEKVMRKADCPVLVVPLLRHRSGAGSE